MNPSRSIRPVVFVATGASSTAESATMPHCLHAEVDQVGRARQLDDGEHRHRPLDQRADAERHRDDLRIDAELAAEHRRQAAAGPAAAPC